MNYNSFFIYIYFYNLFYKFMIIPKRITSTWHVAGITSKYLSTTCRKTGLFCFLVIFEPGMGDREP
jgi:hypothetical protein